MVTTKIVKPNTQTATALEDALGAPAIVAVIKDVKRKELPIARQFDRAVAKGNSGSLNRLRWLCESARAKSAQGKVIAAQEALLAYLIDNRDRKSDPLTKDEWVLLSNRYFNLHLAGCKVATLGRSPQAWSSASDIWDYVYALENKLNYGKDNH